MLTLRVDSSLIPGVNAPITVDALLFAIEPVLGQTGRIVTAVRINGVDEPAFREPDILVRALREEDEVDVETTPVGRMAVQALDGALRYLPDISASAQAMARELRSPQAQPGDIRPAIGNLADNLALVAALVHTADLWARQAGLAATDWLGEDVAAVEQAAGRLEQAASAEDWPAAATTLEHDVPVVLQAWHERLSAGRAEVEALGAVPATA